MDTSYQSRHLGRLDGDISDKLARLEQRRQGHTGFRSLRPLSRCLHTTAGGAVKAFRSQPPPEHETQENIPQQHNRFMHADYVSGYKSQPCEFSYWVDQIDGRIPADLTGTLFRNGPGNFERGEEGYAHTLDGDGYVVAFAFAPGGQVHFSSRYVKTREMIAEEKANAILYRNTFGTQRSGGPLRNAFDMRLKNPANTNVLLWGGCLLALWEAGPPYELDPQTLQTHEGPVSLGGWVTDGIVPSSTGIPVLDRVLRYGKACTAHPHVDSSGSEPRLVIWAWNSQLKASFGGIVHIEIVEFDAEWHKLRSRKLNIDNSMFNPHDFSFTPSSYIFFQSATTFNFMPYLLGMKSPAQCVELRSLPSKIHIASRDSDDVKVYKTEPCFMLHHANAFEDGEEIIVWSSGWGPLEIEMLQEGAGFLDNLKIVHYGDHSALPYTPLWEHRINRSSGEVTMRSLYDAHNLDFPTVNPLFSSRKTRFVFFTMATHQERVSQPLQAFSRMDTRTGALQTWQPGPRSFCGEMIFVPRRGSAKRELNGFLLGMVFDADTERTSLVVLDAANLSKGPLARIWLRSHIPHGLHGCFSSNYYGPPLQYTPPKEASKGASNIVPKHKKLERAVQRSVRQGKEGPVQGKAVGSKRNTWP